MPAKVVDASALGAVLFDEPGSEDLLRALEGFDLKAPALLPFEIASICHKKMKKHPKEAAKYARALAFYGQLSIGLFPVEPSQALAVAQKHGLTTYDASYLALAQALGVELVTLDAALARASR
jgi:predicted nucleic acid-binding protein